MNARILTTVLAFGALPGRRMYKPRRVSRTLQIVGRFAASAITLRPGSPMCGPPSGGVRRRGRRS